MHQQHCMNFIAVWHDRKIFEIYDFPPKLLLARSSQEHVNPDQNAANLRWNGARTNTSIRLQIRQKKDEQ